MSESPDLSRQSSIATQSPEPESSRKRKAAEDDADPDAKKPSKRALKRQKLKASGKKYKKPAAAVDPMYADIDEENQINPAIGKMDVGLLADHVSRQTKKFEPELSVVELEDRRVPAHAFVDTSEWLKVRNLEYLQVYVQKYSPRKKAQLQEAPSENKGEPHTLMITSAGMRAADVTRALRVFQTRDSAIAKLFAKHIKLKEAVESTKNTRMGIGVGTPQRLIDLIKAGALSVAKVEVIIIDASHVNAKKRGILDMPETQIPLIKLLAREEFKARYGIEERGLKVAMY